MRFQIWRRRVAKTEVVFLRSIPLVEGIQTLTPLVSRAATARYKELTDDQRAIFYSSWVYTAIRNLTAIDRFQSGTAISEKFALEPALVNRVLKFLIENELCIETEGRITCGPKPTHVDKDSPFVNKHHQNWRFQAIQNMEKKKDSDLFFTSPMSLSKEALEQIRTLLPELIRKIMKITSPSKSELVACLNIEY